MLLISISLPYLIDFKLCSLINPIYPNATRCHPKKYIVVNLMRAVATEMGQYTLTLYSFIKSDC